MFMETNYLPVIWLGAADCNAHEDRSFVLLHCYNCLVLEHHRRTLRTRICNSSVTT
ncbi:unnamed protein product, partial [Nesidiocoris tenuis]